MKQVVVRKLALSCTWFLVILIKYIYKEFHLFAYVLWSLYAQTLLCANNACMISSRLRKMNRFMMSSTKHLMRACIWQQCANNAHMVDSHLRKMTWFLMISMWLWNFVSVWRNLPWRHKCSKHIAKMFFHNRLHLNHKAGQSGCSSYSSKQDHD